MVELVDSEDLGSSAERRVGSSPTTRTNVGANILLFAPTFSIFGQVSTVF